MPQPSQTMSTTHQKPTDSRNPVKSTTSTSSSKFGSVSSPIMTEGEKFLEFLKSLGYQPSSKSTKKPEYFEYLFRDEKTLRLVKFLMKKITRENVLDSEEVEKFESLKANGQVLYGLDLEEAVDRRLAFDKRLTKDQSNKVSEKEVLKQLVEEKRAEVDEMRNRRDTLSAMIETKKASQAKSNKITCRIVRECKDLDIAIQIAQKRLNDKLHTIDGIKESLLTSNSNVYHNNDIASINWQEILQMETNLFNSVRPLIEKNFEHLIVKSVQPCEEDSFEEISTNGQSDLVIEHAENLERLKHSIIYELVRNAKLKIKLAGEQGAYNSLDACRQQLEQMCKAGMSTEDISKMMANVEKSIRSLDETFQIEYKRTIEETRKNAKLKMDTRFDPLIKMKAPAIKRLESFFSTIYSILEPQKIRIDIMKNIFHGSINHHREVHQRLQELSERVEHLKLQSQIMDGNFDDSALTSDGKLLLFLLNRHDISPLVLRSYSGSLHALTKVQRNIENQDWNNVMQQVNQSTNPYLKHLDDRYDKLIEINSFVHTKHFDKNCEEKRLFQELDNKQVNTQHLLDLLEENKSQRVEESISEKKLLLEKMRKAVSFEVDQY